MWLLELTGPLILPAAIPVPSEGPTRSIWRCPAAGRARPLIWHAACFIHMVMPYLIIVAVGEGQLFRRLQDASGPGVQVILDRRREERRQETVTVSVERRHRDRRTPDRPGWKVRTLT